MISVSSFIVMYRRLTQTNVSVCNFPVFSQKSHQDQITKKKYYCANRHLLPFSFKVDRPPNINSLKPKDQSLFLI